MKIHSKPAGLAPLGRGLGGCLIAACAAVLAGVPLAAGAAAPPAVGEFATFESGPVRPMALSSDGRRLYVVNTPDSRIEVFDVSGAKPVPLEAIPVGLEPVAVALLNDRQLWVVNHLSDSISVVDVSASPARVVNTLLVGDEPRDIVFAGPDNRWAFITAAHRGQNAKFDPKLSTPGVGRADVWVFNTGAPGTALGGTPVTVLNMFGDTLRGLARNADGTRVYTAVLNSGNKTTVLEGSPLGGALDKAGPSHAADGTNQVNTSLIVQKNAKGEWVDSGDPKTNTPPKTWNDRVKLNLPDNDVFVIDATGSTPRVIDKVTGVGTTLFNLAVHPQSGKVYVSNQEALNLTRFEGAGTRSTTVKGHFVESRITVIDGASVTPRHLNKHITSYSQPLGTPAEKAAALATPLEMAISPAGDMLYLAAMGSNKLARFSTAQLDTDSFTPSPANHVTLTGGAPTGVVLDAPRGRAFVTTRFDNGLSVVNTGTFTESAHVKMFNPEPHDVVTGRRFLYDAALTSSRGDSSCAGCHIFGDMDHLAWDLGNPDGSVAKSPNAYPDRIPAFLRKPTFHPMKGPMTTQSLRGLVGNGPMHWRGDRTGASPGATLEERAFKDFNIAFDVLLGRESQLNDTDMTSFARFALKLLYPPNPVPNLDNTLTPIQETGKKVYNEVASTGPATCNSCHVLDPAKGKFGTSSLMSIEGPRLDEDFKVPQLRNMYQKVGMFTRNFPRSRATGDQIRGFGYENAGAQGSVSSFLDTLVFIQLNAKQRDQLEQFVLAFPSDMNPVVGQQVTVTASNANQADIKARLNLLVQRAQVTAPRPECELVAKGVIGNRTRGWVMSNVSGAQPSFVPDRRGDAAVSLQGLLAEARSAATPLTFTCVPPGNGTRIGVDRDANGVLDRD
ncbi:YncE family protein [Caldimonas brevitalea]|uniref:Cytochrome c domain-containing protein n=1 Tax=Caldimonas brevitalea TaxID=413882 RepID=A0A0G3BGL6_9BURK|nr:hypothetical protein [Caldimonas brevitalea]AKJ28584.1 hypothetical protein AAW51_1893 [Caldimonas brevitalea]